jgi:hypothetical protein
MSAKLLKSLAKNKCSVKNTITGEVCVYYPGDKVLDSLVIRSGQSVDLLKYATVAQLRRSPNLKSLVNDGYLVVL